MGKSSDKKSAFGLSAEQIGRLLSIGSEDGPDGVPPEEEAAEEPGQCPSTAAVRSAEGSQRAPQIEGYELIEKVAEAGQGQVWRARHLSTSREVAIKVPRAGPVMSQKVQLRFEREIELAARLNHPHIARIHDSGIDRGQYYYVMDFIDGRTLDEYVQDKRLPHREILELVQTICRAVQHAHQNGVIHRDLKPSNILVTDEGRPYVVDFGLAKAFFGEQHNLTVSMDGETIGTPAYMSPEQASGRTDSLDTRTDVYSLGVILFCLLTGQSPHDLTGSRQEVLRRIAQGQVNRPRRVCPGIDKEIEWLLLKALDPDPDRRYASAGAMAEDIHSYLVGVPLIAGPPGMSYRIRKFVRRNRTWVVASLTVALVIGVGAIVSLVMFVRAGIHSQRSQAISGFLNDSVLAALDARRSEGGEITPISILDTVSAALEGKFRDSPRIEAELRHRLGTTYQGQGVPGRAARHLEYALDIRRRELGNDDPLTIDSMLQLGYAYQHQGRYAEAEPLLAEAVAQGTRCLGQDHDTTLFAKLRLGGACEGLERYDSALQLYEDVLKRARRKGTGLHHHVLNAMYPIGWWNLKHSRWEEGERWLKQATELARQTTPSGTSSHVVFMEDLGLLCLLLNRHMEAEPLLVDSTAQACQLYGRSHQVALRSVENLIYLYAVWGKPDKAAKWLTSLEASRSTDPLGLSGSILHDEKEGTYTIRASGSDIWDLFDGFHFAHKTLHGDGSITARIDAVEEIHAWTKAGIMIRNTLDTASEHASVFITPTGVVAFQHRPSKGGLTFTGGSGDRPVGFPHWVRLTRRGNAFTPEHSRDGVNWEGLASGVPNRTCPVEIAMDEMVQIGLAVTSHDAGRIAEARISDVAISGDIDPAGPFTASEDISVGTLLSSLDSNGQRTTRSYSEDDAAPRSDIESSRPVDEGLTESQLAALILRRGGSSGSVRYEESTDTYTVVGAGKDIWQTSDEFHFACKTITGDGSIAVRIDTVQPITPWTKAGVMMRNALTSDCEHASIFITPENRVCFQYRVSSAQNALSIHTDPNAVVLPHWVRLIRQGNAFKGQHSPDGVRWKDIQGTHSLDPTTTMWKAATEIPMKETTFIGMAVSSHAGPIPAEATMSHLTTTGRVEPAGEFLWSEDVGFQMIMLPKK